MAITIPFDGERFLGDGPAIEKVYKVSAGFTGSGADVIMTTQDTYELANIPANFFVTKVIARVKTAFTASATLTIGDGGDADGFLTSADIAPQTDDDTAGIPANSLILGGGYGDGRYYLAADTIDIVLGGADLDAGLIDVFIFGFEEGFL